MDDTEMSRSLLADLSWRLHPRMEEVAVAALAYILNNYPDTRGGLKELLEQGVPEMRLSDEPFQTEAADPDGTRPDVLQEGDDGKERLFVEAKFHATLAPTQPVPYLERLPAEGVSVLLFLAPSARVASLWPRLLCRMNEAGMSYSDAGSRRAKIVGTGKHLLLADWTTLLDRMAGRLEGSEPGLADLRQLIGLVRFAETHERRAWPAEELVKRVAASGKVSGWLSVEGLGSKARSYGYGRYARLGRRAKLGVWLGVNGVLHEEFPASQLWIEIQEGWREFRKKRWNERIIPTLKDRMPAHVKDDGLTPWVAVVPEDASDLASYATALERIAEILDEIAESQLRPEEVLAEVSRSYEQPVMRNGHRSEYVEAIVALALKDSGWTRKKPWGAWDFEHESGVRLKVKQSAATQSWGGDGSSSPRFGIAPGRVYWDDKEGRCVSQPGRHADVYVFAWHGGTGETADQRDPTSWEFYVVPERDLPAQKTIALAATRGLTAACDIHRLAVALGSVAGSAH